MKISGYMHILMHTHTDTHTLTYRQEHAYVLVCKYNNPPACPVFLSVCVCS